MRNLFALLLLISGPALADGFTCTNQARGLVAQAFNHTHPLNGTRNAATLVLSDTTVAEGNQTIARFSDVNTTLTNDASHYTARVDHRFNDSGREGERIGGTDIGNLKSIKLNVAFSYYFPVPAGTEMPGKLILERRNGAPITIRMVCSRYLVNGN